MNKSTYQYLRREWRVARRNLLAEANNVKYWQCVHLLRELTGRFLMFDERPIPGHKLVRTSSGRYVRRYAGPYACGKRGALSR